MSPLRDHAAGCRAIREAGLVETKTSYTGRERVIGTRTEVESFCDRWVCGEPLEWLRDDNPGAPEALWELLASLEG